MQFLNMDSIKTLADLVKRVGSRSVDTVLQFNSLPRVHNIAKAYTDMVTQKISEYVEYATDGGLLNEVSYQRKATILNTLTEDADVFEAAALQDNDGWKLLSTVGTMPDYIKLPSTVVIPDSTDVLGGTGNPISKNIYNQAMKYLDGKQDIDPVIFNSYDDRRGTSLDETPLGTEVFQWFKIPWGTITLYSSLNNEFRHIPVYPEGWDNEVVANYETMPDMLYQYEPWQVYKSSGPRSQPYTFKLHRDMWTGDHRDGKCNDLIRFCESNCYPRYNGASVQTAIVTLYIAGQPLITGIMTSVKTSYSGPIGLDNAPLFVDLTLNITEVSEEPLNYDSVSRKGVIG